MILRCGRGGRGEGLKNAAKFWDRHREGDLNERQLKAITKIFKVGTEGFDHGVSAKKYMAMTGCSKATATRDLTELVNKGCLFRLEGGGRNIRYALNLEDVDPSNSWEPDRELLL